MLCGWPLHIGKAAYYWAQSAQHQFHQHQLPPVTSPAQSGFSLSQRLVTDSCRHDYMSEGQRGGLGILSTVTLPIPACSWVAAVIDSVHHGLRGLTTQSVGFRPHQNPVDCMLAPSPCQCPGCETGSGLCGKRLEWGLWLYRLCYVMSTGSGVTDCNTFNFVP